MLNIPMEIYITMNLQLISEILTHVSAFFLGVGVASVGLGCYLNRQYKLHNNCCPIKEN